MTDCLILFIRGSLEREKAEEDSAVMSFLLVEGYKQQVGSLKSRDEKHMLCFQCVAVTQL